MSLAPAGGASSYLEVDVSVERVLIVVILLVLLVFLLTRVA